MAHKRSCLGKKTSIQVRLASVGAHDPQGRRPLDELALERARGLVASAWKDLPSAHKSLLRNVCADQWKVEDGPLGRCAHDLLRSAGQSGLSAGQQVDLDSALGVWLPTLRLVLIDAGHRQYAGLETSAYEAALARVAWHEWAHALGVVRATSDDVAAGARLLGLAPPGVGEGIRRAGYGPRDYTHELIAEIYALLMARRRRNQDGQPEWLADEIYQLVRRVCGWDQ